MKDSGDPVVPPGTPPALTREMGGLAVSLAGQYAIERELGRGGMATVYLARDIKHDRRVALKVLDPELGAVLGGERFLSEIRVTANLQHPNLLPLFDSGAAAGLLYYVMPFIEGETLRARLDREQQLPVDEAVRIAVAVASALDYAHQHGVIHRDLKPENILLQHGQPVVADFGIALAVSNAAGNRMTQTGISLGTPQYMSPEQATGDRLVDARSDVYSLGAMTYEMLTGEPPHTGASSQAIIARLLTEKPRSVRATRPNVPVHVEAAVECALEKLAADRFASAREFAEALSGVRTQHQHVSVRPVVKPRRVRESVLAIAAVTGLAGTVYFAQRHPPEPALLQFEVALPDSVTYHTLGTPNLALSPDGTRLVMTGRGTDSRTRLYLRRLDEVETHAIPGTEDGETPLVSFDGRSVLFRVRGTLQRVPIEGGSPRLVADSVYAQRPSWGDADTVLFIRRGTIWAVSAGRGRERVVARPDSARGIVAYAHPVMLPGSRFALVTVSKGGTDNEDASQLAVLRIADGEVTELGVAGAGAQYVSSGHLVYSGAAGGVWAVPFSLSKRQVTGTPALLVDRVPGNAGRMRDVAISMNGVVAYHRGPTANRQTLVAVDRSGAERTIVGEAGRYLEPRVSPDGQRIVVRDGRGNTSGDLWVYEIATGARTKLTTNGQSFRPQWSADGANIVYFDGPDVGARLVMRPWNMSAGETALITSQTTGPRSAMQSFSVGARGGWAAIRVGSRAAGQNLDIWIAPAESLSALRPFLTSQFDELDPHISPDGKLLAYQSNESGTPEVWVTRLPGPAPKTVVSIGGGTEPVWSKDGTTLFYRTSTRLMAATILRTPEPTVVRRESLFADHYRTYAGFAAYDVFPDGRRFAMTSVMANDPSMFESGVQVIVNWPQLLARTGARPER